MTARGIRNNNPGNIRKNPKITWQGQAASQPDSEFVTFKGPEWGLRAIAKVMLSYQHEGFCTVRAIITRWAPPSENDTDAYIAAVCKQTGFDASKPLNLDDPAVMVPLLQAIVEHEDGSQPYADCTYTMAVRLAGLTVQRAA